TADNVEVTVDGAAADALPGESPDTNAEDPLADAVVTDVLHQQHSTITTLSDQDRDVRVDIREAADDSAFGVAIVTAPMAADEGPHAGVLAAAYEHSRGSVGVEGTDELSSILRASSLLEEEERQAVASPTNPSEASPASYEGIGLPFAIGTSMVMT